VFSRLCIIVFVVFSTTRSAIRGTGPPSGPGRALAAAITIPGSRLTAGKPGLEVPYFQPLDQEGLQSAQGGERRGDSAGRVARGQDRGDP